MTYTHTYAILDVSPAVFHRIAQLVIMPVIRIAPQESEFLDVTERGDQGFGSTGVA